MAARGHSGQRSGRGTMSSPPPLRELQVEVTGACNLSCRMCLVRYRPRLDRRSSVSLEQFRRLLDELPDLEEVTLQGLGEPLLAPDLDAMIALAVSRGVAVGLTTNGSALTRHRADRLVRSGITWVHVSLDGATAASTAKVREGINFDRVVANLAGLVAARREAGTSRPEIQLNAVLSAHNVAELADLVRLAGELGVDRLRVQDLAHDFSDVGDDPGFVRIRSWTERWRVDRRDPLVAEHLAAARCAAEELGVDVRLPDDGPPPSRRPGEPACEWPWRGLYVNHDGAVQPCCMLMGSDRGRVGSVSEETLTEIWHGPALAELRDGLMGDRPPAPCRGCAVYRRTF